jgi:hypothetical protein
LEPTRKSKPTRNWWTAYGRFSSTRVSLLCF